MKAKQALESIVKLDEQIDMLIHQKEELRSKVNSLTSNYNSDKVQTSGGNTQEERIIRYLDKTEKINAEIEELTEELNWLESLLDKMPMGAEKSLLYYRYICNMIWEEVAIQMAYSNRSIYRMNRKALSMFQEILDEELATMA